MSKKQSKIYTIKLADWILVDPKFSKKYTQFIPISLRLLGSRQFDLLSNAGKMFTINMIEDAHKLGRSEFEVNERFIRSQGEATEKLLGDLEQNQILTSSLIKKEIKKIKKENFLSNTSVLDTSLISSKLKEEKTGIVKKGDKVRNFSDDILELYEKYYPRKEGRTNGLKKLLKEIKNDADLISLQIAIKNYATAKQGTEKKFIKIFSSFAAEWVDWINHVPDVYKKEETYKSSAFDGVAGVE